MRHQIQYHIKTICGLRIPQFVVTTTHNSLHSYFWLSYRLLFYYYLPHIIYCIPYFIIYYQFLNPAYGREFDFFSKLRGIQIFFDLQVGWTLNFIFVKKYVKMIILPPPLLYYLLGNPPLMLGIPWVCIPNILNYFKDIINLV